MASMADRFAEVGAPHDLARIWFTTVLRDGFARATVGSSERFAVLAEEGLRTLLPDALLTCDLEAAIAHVMDGFLQLPLHADVPGGIRGLRAAGLRLITLTNGSAHVAETLVQTAGLRDEFEQLLSVDDAGVWKPAPGSYAYAARMCATSPHQMLLVAVHAWDIHGAAAAGMRTAWINRAGDPYPGYFTAPDLTVSSLTDLAGRLPH